MHLDTAKHKNAAMDDARYAGVDTLIKQGVCWEDFVKSVNKKSASLYHVIMSSSDRPQIMCSYQQPGHLHTYTHKLAVL